MERSRGIDVFAVDESIALVERLIGLPWPIRLDQFDWAAEQLGWSPTSMPGLLTGEFASGKQRIMLIENEEKDICITSFSFFRPSWEGVDAMCLVNDAFVAYVAAGVEAWGKPFRIIIGKYSHVVWKYSRGVIVDLMRSDEGVHLDFYTPQGVLGYE